MKGIINISDDQYDRVCRLYEFALSDEIHELIIHGVESMKNMTNGDVIQALFPNIKITPDYDYLTVIGDGIRVSVDRNWWYSPYKENNNDNEEIN